MISFPLDILSYGKYIIELQVSSDLSPQAQIPFSVMSEDVVLSTLTTNGTEGRWFDIASQVIIDKGIKRLILKAHASGLKIKRIECIKHN